MAIRMDTRDGLDETYAGAVLQTWEHNGYNDSDFYAAVWDEAEQRVKAVEWATTRWWTYNNSATVDATSEVMAKAERWLADLIEQLLTRADEEQAADPVIGKEVRSTTTRGKNKGVVGLVRRRMANPYRTYYRNGYNDPEALANQRLAVEVVGEDKYRWLDADRVEVINPDQYKTSAEEIRRRAEALAKHRNFMAAFSRGAVI